MVEPLYRAGAHAPWRWRVGEGGGAPMTSANLETMIQMVGFDVVDVINVRRQNFDLKIPMLETVGAWLATKPTSGPMPPMPPR